jgi:molybdate transport system substrate-binding protein
MRGIVPGAVNRMRRAIITLAAATVMLTPAVAHATTRVYAAASLRSAFPQIDGSPTYNFAGSNALQTQIERGAPADVFASASQKEAQALFKEGRCARPVTFATNILVLLVPANNPAGIKSIYSLKTGPKRRLAVGSPGVPVGDYTRQLLARMRLSSILARHTVSNESSVANLTAKVALGSADAGFAYITDAKAAGNRVKSIRLPTWAQPPVRYQACVVKRSGANSAGANAFIKKVTASKGRRVLKKLGFGLPPKG